jgi:hypothetical protein
MVDTKSVPEREKPGDSFFFSQRQLLPHGEQGAFLKGRQFFLNAPFADCGVPTSLTIGHFTGEPSLSLA